MHRIHTHLPEHAATAGHLPLPRSRARGVAVIALVLIAMLGLLAGQAQAASLYWGANGSVGTALTDGSSVNYSVATGCLADYAFFANASTIFGTSGSYICTQDLTGGSTRLTVANSQCTAGVAGLTVSASYIFYTCVRSMWIGRSDLDGSNNNPRFAWGLDGNYPYSLTTDANWLYIGYSGGGEIRRVNPVGGGPLDSTFSVSAGIDMRAVAVDGQHIYWSGLGSRYIKRANLDGTGVNSSWIDTQSTAEYLWGVEVDGSNVYWTSRGPGTVGKADLDGTNVQPTLITGITATNQNHQISIVGGSAKVPLGAAIANTTIPSVAGTVAVSETLTATAGDWAATPDQTYYLWQVSSDSGTTWSPAPGTGTSTSSYRVAIADIGKTLRVQVRAGANYGQLTTVYSAATMVVPAPPAPVNTVVPAFGVNALVSVGLDGTWTNSTSYALTFTYQWETSANGRDGWTAATGPGNNSASYLVQAADATRQLRICVTAFNGTAAVQCSAATAAPTPPAAFGRVYAKSYSLLGDGSTRQNYTNPGGVWGFSSNGVTNVWAEWSNLFSQPAAGGTSTTVTSYGWGTQGGTLIDDQYIYLAVSGAIQRMNIDGTGRDASFITGSIGGAYYMARDAHYLYWGQGSGVSRAPIGGGPKDTTWNLQFSRDVAGLAVDGDYIYASLNGTGIVARGDISGSGSENAWAQTAFSGFTGLGADRNGLYVRARAGSCIGLVYITPDGSASTCVLQLEDDTWALSVLPAAADAGAVPVNAGGADAPTITGTVEPGETLSASAGTWTNGVSYTYRWLASSSRTSGWAVASGTTGTTPSYTIPAGYGGKYLKARVIAHNGSTWSEAAYTNTVWVPATTTTLYWSGDSSVGSVQVNDATGALVDGTRNDSVSTGCVGGVWTWGWNTTTYFGRRGTDEICQRELDGSGSVSALVDTRCSSLPNGSQGVGNGLYATAQYVYYNCFANSWIGRVRTDGTENNPRFASTDSTCAPCGAVMTSDGNWLYIANSGGTIRRIPITGGAPDAAARFSITGLGDVRSLTTDGTYLYWTVLDNSPFIGRARIDGSEPNNQWLNTHSSGRIWGVTATGSRLYWSAYNYQVDGQIGSARLDGSDLNSTLVTAITDMKGNVQHEQVQVVGGTALPSLAPALTNSGLPTISGTATVGQTLTATAGTWSTTPTQVLYLWQMSADSGATWSVATGDGAITSSYSPARRDIGKQVRVQVRAGATGGVLTTVYSAERTVSAPSPLPSTTLYWSGDSSVGSAWINETTGVAFVGGREDSVSTGCVDGVWAWGWNSTTYFGRRGTDEICQKNLDGSGSVSTLVDTGCSSRPGGSLGVGSIYATDEYVYYNCMSNTWIGRINTDGTGNIQHFADSSGVAHGHTLTGDANWLYVTDGASGGTIRRVSIDGGMEDPISVFGITGVGDLRGLTTDGTYLYWTGFSNSHFIGRARIDGSEQDNQWLDTHNPGRIWGITATGSRLYWSAYNYSVDGQIGSARLDGTDLNATFVAGITDMKGYRQHEQMRVIGGTPLPPLAAALTNTVRPSVGGTPAVGLTLTAAAGSWSTTPSQVYYQWEVSADSGTTWSVAAGTNGQSTYAPVISDIGKAVRLKVRAGATGGLLTTAYSLMSVSVAAPAAPVNTTVPAVTVNGLFRAATTGEWTDPLGTPTFTYQWQLSASGTGSWASATGRGNTTAAYVPQTGDVGQYLRVAVTAFNGSSATAYSVSTQVTAPSTLSRISVRSASVLADGTSSQTYATPGGCPWTFSSNGTTHVWGCFDDIYSAPADGSTAPVSLLHDSGQDFGGVLIDDQYVYFCTSATDAGGYYYIQRMKINGTELDTQFIRAGRSGFLNITRDRNYIYYQRGPAGNNSIGRAPLAGGDGVTLVSGLPSNVAGVAVDGDHVYWTYEGDRYNVIGRADISGSAVEPAFITHTFGTQGANRGASAIGVDQNGIYFVIEDGANSGIAVASLDGDSTSRIATVNAPDWAVDSGMAVLPGTPVGALPAKSPGDSVTISGSAGTGRTLTADHGSWSNSPASYTYRWLVSEHGADTWAAATGTSGTTTSYVVPSAYSGKDLKVRVIAHNGFTWSEAAYSSVVTVLALPVNAGGADAPSITTTGSVTVGERLPATHGTWSNAPATDAGYAYEWQVSATGTGGWTPALGRGGTTWEYEVDLTDADKYLRVTVTATNGGGSAIAYSAATPRVAIPAPTSLSLPVISGTVAVGSSVSATHGTWTNGPTTDAGYAYEWQASATGTGGWTAAFGAGGATSGYDVDLSDDAEYLRVKVTATTGAGSTVAYSVATAQVAIPAPSSLSLPEVTGSVAPGSMVTASRGTWSFATDFAYAWQSSADGSTWTAASGRGAETRNYTVAGADADRYLRVRVTGSNRTASLVAESPASVRVSSPAGRVVPPVGAPPAPDVTPGETAGEVAVDATTPAGCRAILLAAKVRISPKSTVTCAASGLPSGLKIVNGKLVAGTPGVYQMKVKIKSAKGKVTVRKVKLKVG